MGTTGTGSRPRRRKVDLERRARQLAALGPRLLALAADQATPLYVYDPFEVTRNLERFRGALTSAGVVPRLFYAVKSNPYPGLLKTVVAAGEGLDVSSPQELRLALAARAQRIVYTGPAKRAADLELVLRHRRRVTAMLESPRELRVLGEAAAARELRVACGIRISSRYQGKWGKFGVPLDELAGCLELARRYPGLEVAGLHVHGGTLVDPRPLAETLELLGGVLRELPPGLSPALRFVDVGGGAVPEAFEGIYPWNREQSMSFDRDPDLLERILSDAIQPRYEPAEVVPLERYAAVVARAFSRHIAPLGQDVALYAEPGKAISHSAMHLLFRVVDVKGRAGCGRPGATSDRWPRAVIVDGGTNMIGWERYEFFDYVPIFNLTRFAPRRERPLLVYGSLCTPHDLWGYYLRGRGVEAGDLLCMPFQGAYTYTLAQRFIRPIPPVVTLQVA